MTLETGKPISEAMAEVNGSAENFESNAEETQRIYGQSDHVRKYGKDYKKRLESSGFKVTVTLPSEFLAKSEIDLYRISNICTWKKLTIIFFIFLK